MKPPIMSFPLHVQRGHLNGFLLCHPVELKVCVHLFNPSPGRGLGSAIKSREIPPPYGSLQLIVLGPLSSIPLVLLTLLEPAVISKGVISEREGFFEVFIHRLRLFEVIPHLRRVFLPCRLDLCHWHKRRYCSPSWHTN